MTSCRHCERLRAIHARGLCSTCWSDRTIRARYPLGKTGDCRRESASTHMTAAQLDELIAEWRPTMPADGEPDRGTP